MKFRIHIETDEDGVFVAECPNLPGCISQGHTRDEAVANIRDAISGYLASLEKHDEPVPLPMTEEVVEVVSWPDCRCVPAGTPCACSVVSAT